MYTILNDCFAGVKKENYPTIRIYIGRSLRACLLGFLYSHTLILSKSKQDNSGNTVFLSSPLLTDPGISPSAGEGEEGQHLGRR